MNKQTFLKELEKRRPSIFEQYSYDQVPEEFKGLDLLTIQCNKHGIFQQKAYNHLYGHGCQQCGIEKNTESSRLSTDEFIQKSITKFGNAFDYSKTVYVKTGVDLTITCLNHGDFIIRPEAHLWLPYGCPNCSIEIPRMIKQKRFIKRSKKVHNNKYDYSRVKYINVNSKVEIICPKHGSFWQVAQTHMGYNGVVPNNCPKCQIEKGKHSTDSFINKAKEVHGDRYDYSKVEYDTIASMLTITCPDHGDFVQRAGSHLSGNRCRQCYIEDNWTPVDDFIKKAKEVHGDKYDYSKANYKGSKVKLEIICPKHGSFWQKPNAHISSKSGCILCSESKGEISVKTFLDKYSLNHVREYRIEPHLYRFDFFLPDYNVFIEFNGQQHYYPNEFFGGIVELRKVQTRDNAKKELIRKNNGKLITIHYLKLKEEVVEQYLIAQLKKLYKYWFKVNDKILVYKNAYEVYKHFNIPKDVPINNIVGYLDLTVAGFHVLF